MKLNNHYFLLRHGQTIYQTKKKGLLYPFPEKPAVKLTKEGEKQIEKLAGKLKNEKIDLFFSSDFFRTRQTAKIISQKIGVKKINFEKRLRDLNAGIFQGGTTENYRNFFLSKKQRFSKRPPGGENWNDVKKRLLALLKEIEKKYQKKNILIISHADPLWLIAGLLKGFKKEEEFLQIRYTNLYPSVGQFIKI